MKTTKIDKNEWKAYLERINAELQKKQVCIEVASLAFGDQIEADWTKLYEISYDPRKDLCNVAVPDVDHRISTPCEIHVCHGNSGIEAIEIRDADDVKHIIRLREPLVLTAPEGIKG